VRSRQLGVYRGQPGVNNVCLRLDCVSEGFSMDFGPACARVGCRRCSHELTPVRVCVLGCGVGLDISAESRWAPRSEAELSAF
jgi:hypothetical protein